MKNRSGTIFFDYFFSDDAIFNIFGGNIFFDAPAVFVYSLNTFLITLFQNRIWDYVAKKSEYLKLELINEGDKFRLKLYCNLDILNGLLTIIVFFCLVIAFILLFTKLTMIIFGYYFFSVKKMISLMPEHKRRKFKNV